MNPIFILWQGSGAAAPPPEIAVVLNDISDAFSYDRSPIRLEPHEWRTLRRIRQIAKRDERHALLALKLFKKRATKARAALRPRVH